MDMLESRLRPSILSALDASAADSQRHQPNFWTSEPASLITKCHISSVVLGTGASIYDSIATILRSTEHELVLVTCFWAQSASLNTLRDCLLHLSDKGHKAGRKIRVRICLSSAGLFQKLFHTQSLDGHVYDPTSWEAKLGLPRPEALTGLDLQIKSIFLKPFSVMHPKFIIVDRQRVLLPSCNVSWEDWFEGCIDLTGDVVRQFIIFWQRFWLATGDGSDLEINTAGRGDATVDISARELPAIIKMDSPDTPCVFLPSPHNINPKFRLPWQAAATPPNTPLNIFLIAAFKAAKESIYIQTPNLTSPPVLAALLDAVRGGVNLHIVTSERLMILEQLVTAGTTTSRCVKKLIKRYQTPDHNRGGIGLDGAAEEGRAFMSGRLVIEYYEPSATKSTPSMLTSSSTMAAEPVQSHLKLTVVDEELVVLGSGNLDRASWYTSQELGVAFYSRALASNMCTMLDQILEKRKKLVYDSGQAGRFSP